MDAPAPESAISKAYAKFGQRVQILLDKSSPHTAARWITLLVALLLYTARVWYLRGGETATTPVWDYSTVGAIEGAERGGPVTEQVSTSSHTAWGSTT